MKALFIGLAWIGLLSVATSAGATNFLIGVDPVTGEANIFIGSGVVSGARDAPGASGSDSTTLLPTQQISLDPETEASLLAQSVTLMTPDLIDALLRNQAQVSAENAAFIAALDRSLGGEPPATEPDFDQAALQADMDRLIAHVVQNAIEQTVLTPEQVQALIDRAGSQAQAPSLPDSSPPTSGLDSEQEAKRQAQLELLEKQRQQKQQQEQQKREQLVQRNQELLKRIEEQKRRVEQQNQQAKQQAADKAREAFEQKLTEAQKRRLAERLTRSGGGGHMDPSAPATPESQRDHLNTVADVGGSGSGSQGSGQGSSGPAAGGAGAQGSGGSGTGGTGGSGVAGAPGPGGGLADVHTDYASQQQQSEAVDEAVEEAAEELAALDPEPTPEPTPEPIDPWSGFLANSDGPRFDGFPSESISGEAVGVYNGLVRGGFESGPSADGTMSLSISFDTYAADGQITFDNGQGVMSMAGDVRGPEFSLEMEGHAFGGTATGNLHGLMYGANGEEIGGGWSMGMHDGALAQQSASGRFAAKQ